MTSPEIQRAARLAAKNLATIHDARGLLTALTAKELTPKGQPGPLSLGVHTIEGLLNLWFAFDGDIKAFRRHVLDKVRHATTYDCLARLVSFRDAPRAVVFNDQTDLILQQTNAALGVLCRHLLLKVPGPFEGSRPGHCDLAAWDVSDARSLSQAVNVTRAALAIFSPSDDTPGNPPAED